jgi:trehalose 6-phosphate phosphatase
VKYLFDPGSSPVLEKLAAANTLCGFDFDGTLSPIVDSPDKAGMRSRTRELLSQLASLYPTVVISGRSRPDVLAKLQGIPIGRVLGNHGAEDEETSANEEQMRDWQQALKAEIDGLSGVWVEAKGHSLSAHYRQAEDKLEAQQTIMAAVNKIEGIRVVGGKDVANLTPHDAPHKGDALLAERTRLQAEWVLFVGDDDNDEDAFAIGGNIVSVRVGYNASSRASFYLDRQEEVDELLERLVRLRKK